MLIQTSTVFGSSSDGYQLFWQATQRTLDSLQQKFQGQSEQPTQQEIQTSTVITGRS